MTPLSRPLDEDTWPTFVQLVEAENGVWDGCWCMGLHVGLGKGRTPEQNGADKQERVRSGTSYQALVLDGEQRLGVVPVRPDRRAAGGQEPAPRRGGARRPAGLGFTRGRPISPHRWVVTRSVEGN